MVIGFILGPMTETNLRRCLMVSENGSIKGLFSPIACVFYVLAVLMIFISVRNTRKLQKRAAAEADANAAEAEADPDATVE
jgi:putative tricarboxylic transport membrane protein